MQENLLRVLIKGGVLSPSEMKQIIELAEQMGLKTLHFGSRQDIIFPNVTNLADYQHVFPSLTMEYVADRQYQNIVSSYVSADIFPATSWLGGATYLNILESFDYEPKLEINIVDSLQQLVPLFTGQINFIASEEEDYWYVYLRLPHWDSIQLYPVLIYTWDIAKVAEVIEQAYKDVSNAEELFEEINHEIDTNNRTISKALNVSFNVFPYYEGMNKMSIDRYWLGLYWRNNQYDLRFLKAMCDLCLESRIGKICLTPWKSLIVKGIPAQDKLAWEKLLGRFGINVRHSSLELNWHLPVADEDALELKRYIVRNFDQNDISTYGLTFGVKSHYGLNFTSIVVEKNPVPSIVQAYDIRPTYNVLYGEKFNPNLRKYITYAQDVDKIELPGLLMELSQLYFEQLGENDVVEDESKSLEPSKPDEGVEILNVWQCRACLTIYDSRYGDPRQGIEPGRLFEGLAADYCCPVCSAPKTSFVRHEGGTEEVFVSS
ncbi:MAG: rubredoxin [Bacteroidota bacterium]